MGQATSFKHDKVIVYLGNDATPTVYTAPCGFTDKALRLEKEMASTGVPDCTDLGAADWEEHDPILRRIAISGGGIMAEESEPTWRAAWLSDDPVPAKVELVGQTNIVTWTGLFHVTSLSVNAAKSDGRARIEIEMASHGAIAAASEAVGG